MVVVITCKNEEDPIKNEGARMFTTLYSNFSDAQGQITLEFVVGWLIDYLRPGKQFFSHVGTEPPLPGYYQYFLGSKCALLKDTTRFDPSGTRTPDLWIRSPRH